MLVWLLMLSLSSSGVAAALMRRVLLLPGALSTDTAAAAPFAGVGFLLPTLPALPTLPMERVTGRRALLLCASLEADFGGMAAC